MRHKMNAVTNSQFEQHTYQKYFMLKIEIDIFEHLSFLFVNVYFNLNFSI